MIFHYKACFKGQVTAVPIEIRQNLVSKVVLLSSGTQFIILNALKFD